MDRRDDSRSKRRKENDVRQITPLRVLFWAAGLVVYLAVSGFLRTRGVKLGFLVALALILVAALGGEIGWRYYEYRRTHKNVPKRERKGEEISDTSVRKGILVTMILLGVVAFVALAGRLAKIMLVDHEKYERRAMGTQTTSVSVTASRGKIYDCNMNVLAASATAENIFLDPNALAKNGVDLDFLAKNLAEITGKSEKTIREKAERTNSQYEVIAQRQNQEVCDKVRAFIEENSITGVHLEPSSIRYYPYNALGAQILGFTNSDNDGAEGLEAYYNSTLKGTAGAVITTKGNAGTEMLYPYEKYYKASDGNSLVLTIDTTVQTYLQKQMQDAIDRYDVLNGAFGIVMDVDTGAVLAMCTLGSYDPNNYLEIYDPKASEQVQDLYEAATKYPDESEAQKAAYDAYNARVAQERLKQWRNRCVSDGYEPGSTFKVITLAAALDSGKVTLNDNFFCGGKETFEGRSQPVNCWRHSGHGEETTAQALQLSCNIAFGHIGMMMGGDTLYDYARAFGLMETTGIDLPGEAGGIFHSRSRLADYAVNGTSYLIATSFGQSIKPTAMQMVRAIAAVVNGGYLVEPYVVSEVIDEDGNVVEKHTRNVLRQVISEETSATMCELLESVVTEGTAGNAKVVGYRIGGKTGTAEKLDQIVDEEGNYTDDKIVSFVGVAPMENPKYVVLIALDTPTTASGQYVSGGVMAAPTVAAVFEDILPYLGVEANYTAEDRYRVNSVMPQCIGMTEAEAAKVLGDNYLEYRIIGSGSKIVSQIPSAGRDVPGYSTVLLYTDDSMPTEKAVVPDLKGKTVAEATKAMNDAGLYLQAKGTDQEAWHVVVTSQDIAAGTEVDLGTTVTVIFADTTAMD